MEKMGWTSGVGLGKNEDGRKEHIDLKYKDNLKGVGFVNGKYDETWLTHSQSFDSVLESLQLSHPSSNNNKLHDFNHTVRQTKTRFT
jgi:Pin2-interacting protein X1